MTKKTMAMSFVEFVNSPTGGIEFKGYSFKVRELLVGAALLLFVIVTIILAAILASSSKKPATEQKKQNVAQFKGQESYPVENGSCNSSDVCLSFPCLETASHVLKNADTSVRPCDNFFGFACGGWKAAHPLDPGESQRTVLHDIYGRNKEKLFRILSLPPVRTTEWASERKLKEFFRSCVGDFQRMRRRGTPFITEVLQKMGWFVLGTWDHNTWDFQKALENVSIDLWTDAFYTFYVTTDKFNHKSHALAIDLSGMGMYWRYYLQKYENKTRKDYLKFMDTIAKLLIRDSNVTLSDAVIKQRVDVFKRDAFEVEKTLAEIVNRTLPTRNPHKEEMRSSLENLNTVTGNGIDWVQFFLYMFKHASITKETRIIVMEWDYIKQTCAYVKQLKGTPEGKRKLHNYMIWRLSQAYAKHLSWEYIHANRKFYYDLTGRKNFLGIWRYCFHYSAFALRDALSSLFVQEHFTKEHRKMVHKIFYFIKNSALDIVSDLPWMDYSTKSYAKKKIKSITSKIGYPDFMMDTDQVDTLYKSLKINESDYFGNVLNINIFHKADWNRKLKKGVDKSEWKLRTFDVRASYNYIWHEMLVPAGILQFPIFEKDFPNFLNFGSMGTLLSQVMIAAIGEKGSYYDADGNYNDWWSHETRETFVKMSECIAEYFSKMVMGPYHLADGEDISIRLNGFQASKTVIDKSLGIWLAFNAFKEWQKMHPSEKKLPGLNMTNRQMFFFAYAQIHCYNMNDIFSLYMGLQGKIPNEIIINALLSHIIDFADTFHCPANSTHRLPQTCIDHQGN